MPRDVSSESSNHVVALLYHKEERGSRIKKEWDEIGNSLEFDFVIPPPLQLSRAVKADEISVKVREPTQPLRLARQSKK